MSESYHDQWRAELDNKKIQGIFNSWIPWVHPDAIPATFHFKLDNFLNGWYVDPPKLCGLADSQNSNIDNSNSPISGCTHKPDGTYTLQMIIEFSPQRYFYVGLIVSLTTLIVQPAGGACT